MPRQIPHRGKTDEWTTPVWLLSRLGTFDLDPSGIDNGDQDGLMMPWRGCVFINPPYGPWTGRWVERLSLHGDGIALVYVRTDTAWFHRAITGADCVLFLRGRLKFGAALSSAPAPSMLMGYGHCAERLHKLRDLGADVRVYIAGPYTKGDVVLNIRAAIESADQILKAGHVPFIPHLMHFWHLVCPGPYEQWTALDLKWLEVCEVLIRLPGESKGADEETVKARQLGLMVFENLDAFLLWAARPE